jgi:drug/metabolite transporter (DMT)-like permease
MDGSFGGNSGWQPHSDAITKEVGVMSPAEKTTVASLTLRGFLVVFLTCLLWGGSIPAIKMSEHGFPPLFMATARITVAALLLLCYGRLIREPVMISREHFGHGALLGLIFGLTMIFLYLGLVFTNADRGTIFYSTKPFWVAMGAHFLIADDRLNLIKVAGLCLALFGVYLTFWSPWGAGLQGDWGNIMEIGAALFFSATVLYTKWLSNREKISHFQTLFAMMLFSIPILTATAMFLEWGHPVKFYLKDFLAFSYQTLGAQFLAYVLWFWLIYRFPVSQVASFTFLVPLMGVILSTILLREPTPPSLWLGLALVTGGIILVNWPRKKKADLKD